MCSRKQRVVENKIVPSLLISFIIHKNRSGHPMEYTFTQTFRPLPAICYGDLWISWTCSVVNVIGAIHLALSDILCFNILQISSKVTFPHKKSKINWSDCFESLQLVRGQMFQLRFFSDINTDARFGFYCCARYHASFCIRRLIRFACLPAHTSLLSVF